VPATASLLFIIAPLLALSSAILASVFVPFGGISWSYSYDLVVLFYFLMGEILFVIMGGITSASLFAVIGGVREIELMLTNEMPFILGTFALAISYNTLSIQEMMGFNLLVNPFAAAVVFIAILVKLHLKPFDISEAESEIVAGLTTEYSGKLLGVLEITRVIMTAVLVALFVDLFLWVPSEGILSWITFIAGMLFTGILIAVVHSLFGRFRIDQATWWLFRFPLLLSILAIVVAVVQRFFL
jgi:NADH-quinone oxidoreductase subunit H